MTIDAKNKFPRRLTTSICSWGLLVSTLLTTFQYTASKLPDSRTLHGGKLPNISSHNTQHTAEPPHKPAEHLISAIKTVRTGVQEPAKMPHEPTSEEPPASIAIGNLEPTTHPPKLDIKREIASLRNNSEHLSAEGSCFLKDETLEQVLALRIEGKLNSLGERAKVELTEKARPSEQKTIMFKKIAPDTRHGKRAGKAPKPLITKKPPAIDPIVVFAEKRLKNNLRPKILKAAKDPYARKVYQHFVDISRITNNDPAVLGIISVIETGLGTHRNEAGKKNFRNNLLEINTGTIIDYIRWNGYDASELLAENPDTVFHGKENERQIQNMAWLAESLDHNTNRLSKTQWSIIDTYLQDHRPVGLLISLQRNKSQPELEAKINPDEKKDLHTYKLLTQLIPLCEQYWGKGGAARFLGSDSNKMVGDVMTDDEMVNISFISRSEPIGVTRKKLATLFDMGVKEFRLAFDSQLAWIEPQNETSTASRLVQLPNGDKARKNALIQVKQQIAQNASLTVTK